MPWCEECDRLVEDEELEEGACPECGTQLVEEGRRPVPWYFRLMIAASVVYLGYRTFQGVTWIVHHV